VAVAQQDWDAVDSLVTTMSRELGIDKSLAVVQTLMDKDDRYKLMAAAMYRQKGDTAASLKLVDGVMNNVSSATPDNQARLLNFAGGIYSAMKPQETEKAIAAYQQYLKLKPDDADALNQMAWLLAVDRNPAQPQEALAYSTRAYNVVLNANRFAPSVYDTHGWVLVLAGKAGEGVPILEKVVAQQPTVESLYHLGEAYHRAGRADDAVAQFNKAKELMDEMGSSKKPVDPVIQKAVQDALIRENSKAP